MVDPLMTSNASPPPACPGAAQLPARPSPRRGTMLPAGNEAVTCEEAPGEHLAPLVVVPLQREQEGGALIGGPELCLGGGGPA